MEEKRTLFEIETKWGAQPVRLTAFSCCQLHTDAPVTSVHFVAFHGGRVLVVCDRRGVFGFPGGRLEPEETLDQAMLREAYEEACAHLNPDFELFAGIRIECTEKLPGRSYPYPYTYVALYTGTVRALDPIRRDPAGIVASRSLFTCEDCERRLVLHDRILLCEAIRTIAHRKGGQRIVRAFLGCDPQRARELYQRLRGGAIK